MSSHPLSNYLRMHRRKAGLSQDEVGFLLGARGGAKTCRYERCARVPALRTVFAYEVMFRTPASELFRGLYRAVEKDVLERATVLRYKLTRGRQDRLTARKLEAIEALLAEKKS